MLADQPQHLGAIVNLGVAYKKLRKRDDALNYFAQALALCPNDVDVISNLGTLQYDQGNYEKAVEYFLKALQIKENDVEALSNLGNGLVKLKDYHTAWVAFDQALTVSPGNVAVIENYILCLLEAKRFDLFDEMMDKLTFLKKDRKERLEKIADEYRTMLGIRTKKQRKSITKLGARQKSSVIMPFSTSGEHSKVGSMIMKVTELSSVQEDEKDAIS